MAGYETTSTTMVWFIHLVSKHPRVQSKIKAEMMNTGNQNDLCMNEIESLTDLDAVIDEVLRFTPPFPGAFRTLIADDRLPGSGVDLFKSDQVVIPVHGLARDVRFWSIDPELFYPERFLVEDNNHHRYAFIPFGSGNRQCMGQDLARFKIKVIAARLMQYVTFRDGVLMSMKVNIYQE